MTMTPERLQEIYTLLSQARVPLPEDLQGPEILLDKLRECRRWADQVITVSTEIQRALAKAKIEVRGYIEMVKLAPSAGNQGLLVAAKDRLDDLHALNQSSGLTRNNLKVTDSAIRLASRLVDQQIKLGAVQPPPATAPPPASPIPSPNTSTMTFDDPVALSFVDPAAQPPAAPSAFGTPHEKLPMTGGVVQAAVDDVSAFYRSMGARGGQS